MGALATLRESKVIHAHSGPVQSVAFGPDANVFATGDTHRNAKVWIDGRSVYDFDLTSRQDKVRPTERIRGLVFSPTGHVLYAACGDKLQALCLTTGDVRWSYRPPRNFGFLIVSPMAIGVSSQGEIAVATDAGRMSVWTPAGALKSHWWDNDSPRMLAFINCERIVGTDSFSVCSWKSNTGRKHDRRKLTERAFGFAATPDGSRLCFRSIHRIDVVNGATNEIVESLPVDFGPPLVAISPDGSRVAHGGINQVSVNTIGSERSQRLLVSGASPRSLRFTPDGASIVAGCSDGTLRFWDVR